MSQDNVEMVRSAYAGADPLAAFADRIASDAEFDFTAAYPDRPVLRGAEAMRQFRAQGPWDSLHFELEKVFDVDDERVLVFVRVTAVGKGSGVPVDLRTAHEFRVQNGRLVRFKVYVDRDQALEAAGLKE